MQFQLTRLITMIVAGVFLWPSITNELKPPRVTDEPNDNVVLAIYIEIPLAEPSWSRGEGWLDRIIQVIGTNPVPPRLNRAFEDQRLRICGLAIFPTPDGSEYHYFRWSFQSSPDERKWKIRSVEEAIQLVLGSNGTSTLVINGTEARGKGRSLIDGRMYFRNSPLGDECKEWIRRGALEFPIFIWKHPGIDGGSWEVSVEQTLLRRFAKANETVGLLIVCSVLGNFGGIQVYTAFYDLASPQTSLRLNFSMVFSPELANFTVQTLHQQVIIWTTSCSKAYYEDRCYFGTKQECLLREMIAGGPDQTPDMVTFRYCARNVSYYHPDPSCTRQKCEETCDLLTQWTKCNSTCGGYRWLQLRRNPAATPYRLSSNLTYCPRLRHRKVDGRWFPEMEECSEGCASSIAMIVIGFVLLLLLIVCGVAGYFFVFKLPTMVGPVQKKALSLGMSKEASVQKEASVSKETSVQKKTLSLEVSKKASVPKETLSLGVSKKASSAKSLSKAAAGKC